MGIMWERFVCCKFGMGKNGQILVPQMKVKGLCGTKEACPESVLLVVASVFLVFCGMSGILSCFEAMFGICWHFLHFVLFCVCGRGICLWGSICWVFIAFFVASHNLA